MKSFLAAKQGSGGGALPPGTFVVSLPHAPEAAPVVAIVSVQPSAQPVLGLPAMRYMSTPVFSAHVSGVPVAAAPAPAPEPGDDAPQ